MTAKKRFVLLALLSPAVLLILWCFWKAVEQELDSPEVTNGKAFVSMFLRREIGPCDILEVDSDLEEGRRARWLVYMVNLDRRYIVAISEEDHGYRSMSLRIPFEFARVHGVKFMNVEHDATKCEPKKANKSA